MGRLEKRSVKKRRLSSGDAAPAVEQDEAEADVTGDEQEENVPNAPTAPAGEMSDEELDAGSALLKLRSLLAPASGQGKDVQAEAATAEAEEKPVVGPDWTSRYHVVNASDAPTPLEELSQPLHPAVARSLQQAGIKATFPIQTVVIPLLSRSVEASYDEDSPHSCDVCVAAPTGQGKTLAYAVPIVQALLSRAAPRVRALVILPTRDLALQVHRVFEMLRRGLGPGVAQVKAMCLVGQKSLSEEAKLLKNHPPDIVVCTPGKLYDHVLGRDASLDLSALRWFVVDEADRLLTESYHRWLDILDRVSSPSATASAGGSERLRAPQKLLLSATMTWNPQKLSMLKLKRPLFFFSSKTGQHATPEQLHQHMLKCKQQAKPLALLHILASLLRGELSGLESAEGARAVVFCSSVDTAHRLARLLQICVLAHSASAGGAAGEQSEDEASRFIIPKALCKPGAIAEFSANLTQRDRSALLNRFRQAKVRCLICSDVVARGIDIPEVSVVVNYTAPVHIQTYIHRVGRTARAGRIGHTFTFVQRTETTRFEKMLGESADCLERIRQWSLPKVARDIDHEWYSEALSSLSKCFALEESGKLSAGKALEPSDLGLDGELKAPEKARKASKAGVEADEASDESDEDEVAGAGAEDVSDHAAADDAASEEAAVATKGAKKKDTPKDRSAVAKATPTSGSSTCRGSMLDFLRQKGRIGPPVSA